MAVKRDIRLTDSLCGLSDGDVEATLMDLVLDITEPSLALIAQNLTQYPLETVIARLSHAGTVRILYDMVFAPADVKGSAVAVATVFCRILIALAQEGDIILATHERGDDDLGRVDSLDHLAVDKGACNVIEKHLRSGYKVRYTVVEALEIVVGAVADVHELTVVGMGCRLAILYRLYAKPLGRRDLYVVEIRKCSLKSWYTQYAVALARRSGSEVRGQQVRRRE